MSRERDNRIRVYVAGPYSKGDVAINVRDAVLAANKLWKAGFIPYTPHLTHFFHMICPHEYPDWLDYDLVWMEQCEAVLRIPGASSGADGEVEHAVELGMNIFFSPKTMIRYYRKHQRDRLELPKLNVCAAPLS